MSSQKLPQQMIGMNQFADVNHPVFPTIFRR